jgi:hypothetical protein
MNARDDEQHDLDLDDDVKVTSEVGSEGGSPGDVEVGENAEPAAGSEAAETWNPTKHDRSEIVLDEKGRGRRTP